MTNEEFPFKVVRTNGHDEVLAPSINLLMGRAAFETAKRLYPKDAIEYRKALRCWTGAGREAPESRAKSQPRPNICVRPGSPCTGKIRYAPGEQTLQINGYQSILSCN
jgi:hypothetical protein